MQGYPAKDGAKMANARNVVFADGRKIFAGSTAAPRSRRRTCAPQGTGFSSSLEGTRSVDFSLYVSTLTNLGFVSKAQLGPEKASGIGRKTGIFRVQ